MQLRFFVHILAFALDLVRRNSSAGELAYNLRSNWFRITAMKTKRTWIYVLAVFSLPSSSCEKAFLSARGPPVWKRGRRRVECSRMLGTGNYSASVWETKMAEEAKTQQCISGQHASWIVSVLWESTQFLRYEAGSRIWGVPKGFSQF